MIDLHNHILPRVDDGAEDLQESVEIGRRFVKEGINTIVATPHLDPLRGNGVGADTVPSLVREVQGALDAAGVDLRVLPGNELFLTPDAPALIEGGTVMTLNGGPHVLVETAFDQLPLYLYDVLFRIQTLGYMPVLAHPERYSFVVMDPGAVQRLVERDVALQLTAPSLLGEYGPFIQRVAVKLLRRGQYSLAASDRHHPGGRRSLTSLHARIAKIVGCETADLLLQENPQRVLDGTPLVKPKVPEPVSLSVWRRLIPRRSR